MAYDRLSAQDTAFLHLESARTPMHVGSLAIFEAAPFFDDLGRFLRGLQERTAFRDVYLTRQAERKVPAGGQEELDFAVTLTYQGRRR